MQYSTKCIICGEDASSAADVACLVNSSLIEAKQGPRKLMMYVSNHFVNKVMGIICNRKSCLNNLISCYSLRVFYVTLSCAYCEEDFIYSNYSMGHVDYSFSGDFVSLYIGRIAHRLGVFVPKMFPDVSEKLTLNFHEECFQYVSTLYSE